MLHAPFDRHRVKLSPFRHVGLKSRPKSMGNDSARLTAIVKFLWVNIFLTGLPLHNLNSTPKWIRERFAAY